LTQASNLDAKAKDYEEQLNMLKTTLEISSENGLFQNDSTVYTKILNFIIDAFEDLSNKEPKIIEAGKKFSLAYQEFNQAVNSKSLGWRFKYCYGGPALLYLLVLFALISGIWFFFGPNLLDYNLLWVPSWAFIWGLLGGVLQGFWWIWQHISKRKFRKSWYVWFLLLPFIGAILGALTYLIYFGGFIATTGNTQIQSTVYIMLLCALAGFSSRWAIEMLSKITTLVQIGT
jgi:hypothetical protein